MTPILTGCLLLLEEGRIGAREARRDRRGAEEELEAALGQVGRDRLRIDEGNAVALGDGARGDGDPRLIGTDQGRHLLFRDQAQRLVLAGRRRALVVGEDELDLGATQARQAAALGDRHELGELGVAIVDHVGADFDRHLGVVARAR